MTHCHTPCDTPVMITTDRLLTPEDLAEMLHVSVESVYDLSRQDGPPRIKIGRRTR